MKSVKVPIERWLQESHNNGPWTQLAIGNSNPTTNKRQISETVQSIEDWFLGKSPRKSDPTKDGLRVLAENISAALDSSSEVT